MVIALKHTPSVQFPACRAAWGGAAWRGLDAPAAEGAAPLPLAVCELLSVLPLRAEPRAPRSQPAPGSRGSAHGVGPGGTRRARPQLLGQRKVPSAATAGAAASPSPPSGGSGGLGLLAGQGGGEAVPSAPRCPQPLPPPPAVGLYYRFPTNPVLMVASSRRHFKPVTFILKTNKHQ